MGDLAVMDVECSMCDAMPGEDCGGPGEGWHLSRFDRLQAVLDGNLPPVLGGDA